MTSHTNRRKHNSQQLQEHLYLWEDILKKELFNSTRDRYSELGRYCEVIGRPTQGEERTRLPASFEPPKKLDVTLADGTRWAKAADLGQGVAAELRLRLRERFGGVIVLLDYDGDGKQDSFLLAAVVRQGTWGKLLFWHEGNGPLKDGLD